MKLALAASIYILAFVAQLFPMYMLARQESYADWRATLHAFNGSPFPGTELLVLTLRAWWVYPLLSAAVFVYGLLLRKRLLASVAFMVALAVLFLTYYLGPVVAMGRVV